LRKGEGYNFKFFRAIVMGNKDKLGFVEQHISSGIYNKTFKDAFEMIIPKNRYSNQSIPEKFNIKVYNLGSISNYTILVLILLRNTYSQCDH
jgi:hypothetical protein